MTDMCYLWRHRERPKTLRRHFVVLAKRTLQFIPLLRLLSRAVILRARGASIGDLAVIGKARINGNIRNLSLGAESSLGRCKIALHDRVSIGKKVVINDGTILLTASHRINDPQWPLKKAPITIGDYAWIATGCIILPGVSVGKGAVIGAGAVVRSDVPDYAIVSGNPATIADFTRNPDLDYSPVLMNAPFEAWVGRGRPRQEVNT